MTKIWGNPSVHTPSQNKSASSLYTRALLNKSLELVKYFICGKGLKLFYHHDL